MKNTIWIAALVWGMVASGCHPQQKVDMALIDPLEGKWTVARMAFFSKNDPFFARPDSTWSPRAGQQLSVVVEGCNRKQERNQQCQGYSDYQGNRNALNYYLRNANELVFFPPGELADTWHFNGNYRINFQDNNRLWLFSNLPVQLVRNGPKYSLEVEMTKN